MICCACKTKIKDDVVKCPRCGFTAYYIAEVDQQKYEQALDEINQIAKEHIQKCLAGVIVGMTAYRYKNTEEGKLELDETKEIELVQANQLISGEIIWYKEKFTRIDTKEAVTLTIFVKKKSGQKTQFQFQVYPPKVQGFTYLGVQMLEGLHAKLVWGDKNVFVSTDAFSLI